MTVMKFYVIGIDDNQSQYFNPEILDIINNHSVFSGGVRHYEIVKSLLPEDSSGYIQRQLPKVAIQLSRIQ